MTNGLLNNNSGKSPKKKRRRLAAVKTVLYLVIGLFLFLAENSWYTLHLRTPALLAVFTVTVGMLEGPEAGAVCGLLCGLFSDAAGGGTLYYSPLLFLLYGYAAGSVTRRFWKRRFPVFLCLLCFCAVIHAVVALLASLILARSVLPAGALFSECGKNALCTALWGLLLWLPLRRVSKITDRAGRTVYVRRKAERL